MRTRWVVVLLAGGLCAWAHGTVQLEELSGYVLDTDYHVAWRHMDPNDPGSPLGPDITILQYGAQPYQFRCWNDVTGDPADIYRIGGDAGSPMFVYVKVLAADGSPGAANVGWLDFPGNMQCWIRAFNITGTLGTLGLESHIRGTYDAPFTVADLAAPLMASKGIWNEFSITGPGPHLADLSVGEFYGATTTITGEMAGDITVDSSFYNSSLTINGNLTGDLSAPYLTVTGSVVTIAGLGPHVGNVLIGDLLNSTLTISGDLAGGLSVAQAEGSTVTINGDADGAVWSSNFYDTSLTVNGNLNAGASLFIAHLDGPVEAPPTISVTGSASGPLTIGSG